MSDQVLHLVGHRSVRAAVGVAVTVGVVVVRRQRRSVVVQRVVVRVVVAVPGILTPTERYQL